MLARNVQSVIHNIVFSLSQSFKCGSPSSSVASSAFKFDLKVVANKGTSSFSSSLPDFCSSCRQSQSQQQPKLPRGSACSGVSRVALPHPSASPRERDCLWFGGASAARLWRPVAFPGNWMPGNARVGPFICFLFIYLFFYLLWVHSHERH